MLDQVEQVGPRLRRHGLRARGVSLKIRFGDFQTINRSTTFPRPTDATTSCGTPPAACSSSGLPTRAVDRRHRRALSSGEGQLDLFADPEHERQRKVDAVADRINQRFGKRSIRRGGAGG